MSYQVVNPQIQVFPMPLCFFPLHVCLFLFKIGSINLLCVPQLSRIQPHRTIVKKKKKRWKMELENHCKHGLAPKY